MSLICRFQCYQFSKKNRYGHTLETFRELSVDAENCKEVSAVYIVQVCQSILETKFKGQKQRKSATEKGGGKLSPTYIVQTSCVVSRIHFGLPGYYVFKKIFRTGTEMTVNYFQINSFSTRLQTNLHVKY